MAVVLAGAVFPPPCPAQEGEDILRTLIEKARERERLMDNVEASILLESLGTGGAPLVSRGRWARSGDLRFIEYELCEPAPPGKTNLSFLKHLSTRQFCKELNSSDGTHRGSVAGPYDGPVTAGGHSPEHFGVTAVPHYTGTLAGMLEGGLSRPYLNRARSFSDSECERAARPLGEGEIDGRALIVVEVTESVGGAPLERSLRLYFDRDLDCSCVASEIGKMEAERFVADSRWCFSEFREVRPGLFVPMRALWERSMGGSPMHGVLLYRIETLDFRPGFAEDFFDVEFPPGTQVYDGNVRTRYTVGQSLREAGGDAALEDLLLAGETVSLGELEEAPQVETDEAEAAAEAPAPQAAPAAEDGETPAASETGVPDQGPAEKTGEQNRFIIVFIIVVICVLAIAAVVLARKRRG